MTKVNKSPPKGRKRLGWNAGFVAALGEAAVDLGDLSEKDALHPVRNQRSASKPDHRTEVCLRYHKRKV